jgi:hypothetical protein
MTRRTLAGLTAAAVLTTPMTAAAQAEPAPGRASANAAPQMISDPWLAGGAVHGKVRYVGSPKTRVYAQLQRIRWYGHDVVADKWHTGPGTVSLSWNCSAKGSNDNGYRVFVSLTYGHIINKHWGNTVRLNCGP